MKKKLKYHFIPGILYVAIPFLFWNCENEHIETGERQQGNIETVSVNEAVDFFNLKTVSGTAKTDQEAYVIPHLAHISQEEIINSDALLTVIPATTIHEAHYSRILLLRINNEIQSLVFSMYASGDKTQEYFSGEILITDLQGNFLNGYRVENGVFISQFGRKNGTIVSGAARTGNAVCPQHGECTAESDCILCLQELEEVVVTGGSGGSGEFMNIYVGLNDFPGIDEGGDNGPDMGLEWDYGPGEGGSPDNNSSNDDKINIDDTVPPCVEQIIAQLQEKDNHISVVPDIGNTEGLSHISQIILDLFSASQQYHLSFTVVENLVNNNGIPLNGGTKVFANTPSQGEVTIRITLNDSFINNATALAIARTIIHESVHAYLSHAYIQYPDADFTSLFNLYMQDNGVNENMAQHALMTEFVEAMGHSLAVWDNYSLPQDYYNSLCWSGGMIGTEAFGLLSAQEQQAAVDANIAEGQANAPATANAQGSDCN